MLERDIEKKVKEWARRNGWLAYKFTSPANRSVPDGLFIKNGMTVYIEFKRLGKKPTELQAKTIQKIRDHGAPVFVIDSVEDGINALKSF